MPTSTAILNVQLVFDSCFACTCFGSSSIFAYSKKWIKESVSNFVWKTKLRARTHSECGLWHMVNLPWTEATFIGGTKCFPRTEKMWTTKSVRDARARQQQTKTLMKWNHRYSSCWGPKHTSYIITSVKVSFGSNFGNLRAIGFKFWHCWHLVKIFYTEKY